MLLCCKLLKKITSRNKAYQLVGQSIILKTTKTKWAFLPLFWIWKSTPFATSELLLLKAERSLANQNAGFVIDHDMYHSTVLSFLKFLQGLVRIHAYVLICKNKPTPSPI